MSGRDPPARPRRAAPQPESDPNVTLALLPATELAARIRNRGVSPVEVVRDVLDRIARFEPRLNAFARPVNPERVLAHARAAERQVMAGEPLGPLHGVPVTIKDLYQTTEDLTEGGSHTGKGFQAAQNAPLVERLLAAGAIVVGKTTTPESGWKGVSQSPLTGITHNPWRHGFNAGASSAGAGSAAAAGFGPLHQGGDGAGSIRMPAHFCGIFGLKTSYGRIPQFPVPTGDYTSGPGPMTRTVADSALMLRVMAGPHWIDHTTCETPPPDYLAQLQAGIRGRRIGWSADLGHARVDPEVAALCAAAARRFEALGAIVEEVTPAWGPQGAELIRFFWPAHMARFLRHLPEYEGRLDPGLVACAREGAGFSVSDYQGARERKYAYIRAIAETFTRYDFLLTPSCSVAAFPAHLLQPEHWPQHPWDWLMWAEFLYPFNLAGFPASNVPCGFTSDGLPVGLQIAGARFDELGVLQASAAFEAAFPWAAGYDRLDAIMAPA